MARTRFTARTFRAGIALTILAVSIAACKPPRVSPASAYWPSTPSNGPYWPVSLARGIAACPGGGGYIADAYGGIHAFTSNGLRPERVTQTAGYWPGRDIVRGLAVNSDCTGGWTLDSYGALQPFATGGHALPPIPNVTTYGPSTNARGVAYAADLRSGYVVDGNGRFFPFALPGNALPGPAVLTNEYETATSDWVRGATLSPDGRSGYIVDASGVPYEFVPGNPGGRMAPATGGPFWDYTDFAAGISFSGGCGGAYILDNRGTIYSVPTDHFSSCQSPTPPPSVTPTAPPIIPPSGADCTVGALSMLAAEPPLPDPEPLSPADTQAAASAAVQMQAADGNAAEPISIVSMSPDGRPKVTSTTSDDPRRIASLAAMLDVADDILAIEPAQRWTTSAISTDPARGSEWALDQFGFESVWPHQNGAGITVAVVDSGVAAVNDLSGALLAGRTFLFDDGVGTPGQTDQNGHGTHVAGIIGARANNGTAIAGMAPGVSILPVRVLDATGEGYDGDIASGITWAVDQGASVVNLSLGGPDPSFAVETAVNYAESHGVVVVTAAGNSGTTGNAGSYPSAYPTPIAVGALTITGALASFSTRAPYVDVVAPGVNIVSLYYASASGTATITGTSQAAPHVSALVAMMRAERPTDTPSMIRNRLYSTATGDGTGVRNDWYGWGRINPRAAVGC